MGAVRRREESCVLALSKGDDYPIHQTPEPVAYAGHRPQLLRPLFLQRLFDAAGDTSSSPPPSASIRTSTSRTPPSVVVRDGVETALHASRCLNMERMDMPVGPIRIEVIEPLQSCA